MAKLEAMLEQRGIATSREMSEAIARCQLHGGDLTTSLLQFVSADETLLSAALSECYGLPAAVVGALPAADDGALRSLPRDIAERYCCFPLEASPGRLVLAVAHPLEPALKDELGATLGVVIEERVALEVRIRQALSRHYGLPLSARNQRGIARLEGDIDAGGHETPLGLWSDAQLSALPRPPSELPPSHRDSPRPPSMRPRARNDGSRLGSSAPPSPNNKPSRRREPTTLARAREELGRAGARNEVLDIFFGFACQFFEYSALFAVHNALAEGLDASGKGADRDTVLGIGVPLDLPSSLSEAAESCKVRLTRLGREGIDRQLAVDLQRQFNARALLLPVSLRGRCAVLLYADNGEADVVERDIADLIALAPDVANALARIILQRKKDAKALKSSDPADGGSLAPRRSQPAASQPDPSPHAMPEAALDEVVESRPARQSTPVPAPSNRDGVQTQPVVSIGADTSHVTRSRASSAPLVSGARLAEPAPPSDDPVFLLARPQPKGHASDGAKGAGAGPASTATPQPGRAPVSRVQKPQVSITVPARLVASRPRLPSVIVDPESADPEATERATRAAAITRAPTQARTTSSMRRPFVPPPADAPRRNAEDAFDPRLAPTSPPAARADHRSAARAADVAAPSRPSHAQVASRPDAQLAAAGDAPLSARSASPPTSGLEREPFAARGAAAALMPPAVSEVDPDSLEDIGGLGPSSDVWPPPIMDHSPPPQQPALTALVPIIIADSPKNRRMINARNAATARPGNRRGAASSPPSPSRGGSAPTVPSPARARAPESLPRDGAPAPIDVRTIPSGLRPGGSEGSRNAVTIPAARHPDAMGESAVTVVGTAVPAEPSAAHAHDGASANGAAHGSASARAAVTQPSAGTTTSGVSVSREPSHTPTGMGQSAGGETAQAASTAHAEPAHAEPTGAASTSAPSTAGDATATAAAPHVVPAESVTVAAQPLAVAAESDAIAAAQPDGAPRAAATAPSEARPAPTEAGAARPTPPDASVPAAPAGTSRAVAPNGSASSAAVASAASGATSTGATPASAASGAPAATASPGAGSTASRARAPASPAATLPARAAPALAPRRDASAPSPGAASAASPTMSSPVAAAPRPGSSTGTRLAPTAIDSSRAQTSGVRASERPPASIASGREPAGAAAPSAAAASSGARPTAGATSSISTTLPVSAPSERRSWPPSAPIHSGARVAEHAGAPVSASRAGTPRAVDVPGPTSREGTSPVAVSGVAPANPSGAATLGAHAAPPASTVSSAASMSAATPAVATPAAGVSAERHERAAPDASSPANTQPGAVPPWRPTAPSATSASTAEKPPASSPTQRAIAPSIPKPSSVAPSKPGSAGPASVGSAGSPKPSSGAPSKPGSAVAAQDDRPAIFPPPPPADAEIEELLESVCQGDPRAVQDLARIGAPSLPHVMARFPGPVISERPSSRASECGPLLRALAAIGSPAMPSITKRSEDGDARVRRWATLLLGEMPSLEACHAVVQRLADDEPRVHQAALDAARLLLAGPAAEAFRDTLFEVAEADDAPLTLRLRTLEHVAKLKDSASVPRLVAFLSADVEPIVHKALWALTVVTRHDFGRDARAWTEFYEHNRDRPRIQWLIDALDPSYPRTNKAAADELREEAGELFGYAEDQSPAERREVQERFRTWWQNGAVRRRSTSP